MMNGIQLEINMREVEVEALEVKWKFKYTAQVTPPRCRKPRDEEREGQTSVRIPCPTDFLAPVAVVEVETLSDGSTVERKYRLFDGRLWHTKKFNESGLREDPLSPVTAEMEDTTCTHLDWESHVNKINQWASDLIIVNGMPHCPLPGEPRVFVEFYYPTADESKLSIERCFGYYRTDIRKSDYYPLGEFDRAQAEAERLENLQQEWVESGEKLTKECRYSFRVLINSALTLNCKADYEAEMEERFAHQVKRMFHELERTFSNPKDRIRALKQLMTQVELQVFSESTFLPK